MIVFMFGGLEAPSAIKVSEIYADIVFCQAAKNKQKKICGLATTKEYRTPPSLSLSPFYVKSVAPFVSNEWEGGLAATVVTMAAMSLVTDSYIIPLSRDKRRAFRT